MTLLLQLRTFCVDNKRINSISTSPTDNGLSDHNVQLLIIDNIYAATSKICSKQRTGVLTNEIIMHFHTLLKNET
jgi:hypothetical protein